MANLKLFHVNKVYDGGVHAVKDFCLDVADKEFVVFVGPSGCGKSTVLRMIAGLEKISSGDAYIGDRLVNALPAKERNIAMVFQNYALFPNMSVYDNISYGLRMQGEDKEVIREKVTAAAQMLNLTDHLNRKPSQLSGGQRQRVALGRAIVRDPDVFLLDEPLSNLDAKLRNKMRAEIMALHRRLDATFIYVTHDQVEAMTMGDKIVVMRDGVIMQVGSPAMLYRYPANTFVAGFIGTPQMNFWRGEISVENGLLARCPVASFPLNGELALRLEETAKKNGKEIIIGLRPEDISLTRRHEEDVELSAHISVVEDFCSYGVFHGEVNGVTVVGQDTVGTELQGKDVKLYINVENLHIFDAETETTLLPQYAPSQLVPATKKGDTLQILGGVLPLPDQLKTVEDGALTVRVSADAVTEGTISMSCAQVQKTENGHVSLLRFGEVALYAKGDFSGKNAVGLDMSRLQFSGSADIQPIPAYFDIPFSYERRKIKDNGRTVKKHFCILGSTEMEAYYDFNRKMYRLGRRIFRDRFVMRVTSEQLRVASDDECYPTLSGTVVQVMDYGDKQYSQVSVGEHSVYVQEKLSVGETVVLAVDTDHVQVRDSSSDTILF